MAHGALKKCQCVNLYLTLSKTSPQSNYVYVPVKTDTQFCSSHSKSSNEEHLCKNRKRSLAKCICIMGKMFSMHLSFSASFITICVYLFVYPLCSLNILMSSWWRSVITDLGPKRHRRCRNAPCLMQSLHLAAGVHNPLVEKMPSGIHSSPWKWTGLI